MKTLKNALLALGLFSLTAAGARATTIYTYTGNPFTKVTGAYTTSMFVSGSFTVDSPLAANQAFSPVSPTAFSFSDGLQTLDQSNGQFVGPLHFQVGTDASGGIASWFVSLYNLAGTSVIDTAAAFEVTDSVVKAAEVGGLSSGAFNVSAPGQWTVQTVGVPDAGSSVALLALSLAALVGAARWFEPLTA
jgi:hypothetical protein